jgi:hypothetical protein
MQDSLGLESANDTAVHSKQHKVQHESEGMRKRAITKKLFLFGMKGVNHEKY